FKAYLESIIAALSVSVPSIKCFPDNADDTLDLATAKAGDKIAELVYRHNNVSLLWLHALFVYCTEGMVACYSYPVESDETYESKEYDETTEDHEITTCSNCGHTISDSIVSPTDPNQIQQEISQDPTIQLGMQNSQNQPQIPSLPNQQSQELPSQQPAQSQNDGSELRNNELDEFMPDNEDASLHYTLMSGQDLCPACMQMMDPEISREKLIVTRLVGITSLPKTRMCLEAYGGLNVKIPNFAKTQKKVPYLIFSEETDYSLVVNEFEHLHGNKKLLKSIKGGNPGSYNQYDQWGRLSPQYQGEYPLNVVTVNKAWIRPAKFNILQPDDSASLKKEFPDGVKAIFVNDEFAHACNESLDDCWTLFENPLSDFLHFDPAGQGLVSIQDITNDLVSLVLQTIEHGIGQTFADPAVVNFKAYEQTEVVPGGIFPATPKSGKSLS